VVSTDEAGVVLRSPSGPVRATWGGSLLLAMAAGRLRAVRPGDVAEYLSWPDGVTTVERIRPAPPRLRSVG
jgi:hypothetical protein